MLRDAANASVPRFRCAHIALACVGVAAAGGVLSLDASEWTHWLTAGGEVTASRAERVAAVRGTVALAACAVVLLGLAGALRPAPVCDCYVRLARAVDAAVATRRRPQRLARAVAAALLATAAMLGFAYAVHRATGAPLADLVRDPASVAGVPPWTGLLSNFGILLWASAAAICFFGATAVAGPHAARRRGFLWASGALTAMLGLDDAFLLHEEVLPALTGLPEIAFTALYPALLAVYLARYGALLLGAEWLLWAAAAALLGASAGLDTVTASARRVLVEDGLKLAGIVFWLVCYARTVRAWMVAGAVAPARGATNAPSPGPRPV